MPWNAEIQKIDAIVERSRLMNGLHCQHTIVEKRYNAVMMYSTGKLCDPEWGNCVRLDEVLLKQ